MSGDDDDITIEFNDQKEYFNHKEANDANAVRIRFELDHEPACVFEGKKKKRVEFGSLEADRTYMIEVSERIPNLNSHIQNTLALSLAAYEDDQTKYLTESSTYHTVEKVVAVTNKSCKQGAVLAVGEVGGKKVLYVAFRGTRDWNWDDIITDVDIELEGKAVIPGAKYHNGFLQRSRTTVTPEKILHCAGLEDCETIITCGHSLGGAVSAITMIDLMKHLGPDKKNKGVYNITFGAPFFGNKILRDVCKEEKIASRMIHYVGHQDIVPGILSLAHTAKYATKALNAATGGLFEACKLYLQTAGKIASFVLGNIPWGGEGDGKSDIQVLCNLTSKLLGELNDTNLGEEYSDEEFVPIGNFYIIEIDKVSQLDSGTTTSTIQNCILKDPIRRSDSIQAIKKGHGLADHYYTSLKKVTKFSLSGSNNVDQVEHLQPKQEGKAKVILVKDKRDGHWTCTLVIKGFSLQNSTLQSDVLKTAKLTSDAYCIYASAPITEAEKQIIDDIEIKIITPFGVISIDKEPAKKNEAFKLPTDIMSEPALGVLHKSIVRCMGISALKQGNTNSVTDLKEKLETILEIIGNKKEFQDLLEKTNIFTKQEDILKHLEHVSLELKQIRDTDIINDVSDEYLKILCASEDIVALKKTNTMLQAAKWLCLGVGVAAGTILGAAGNPRAATAFLALAGAAVGSVYPDGTMVVNMALSEYYKDFEKMYRFQSAWLMNFIMQNDEMRNLVNGDSNTAQLMGELHNSHDIPQTKKVAILEMIIHKKKDALPELFPSMAQWLQSMPIPTTGEDDTEMMQVQMQYVEIRKKFENAIKIASSMHEIREAYSKSCFIGFVGPQNAGKSTLLNNLYGLEAKTGSKVHTEEPTIYYVGTNQYAIDFPASDSVENYSQRFKQFGFMNNLFIYIMPYDGTPNQSVISYVRDAYHVERLSGRGSKTLFCVNKCGRLDYKNESFLEIDKETYVEKIREALTKYVDEVDEEIKKILKKNKDTKTLEALEQFRKEDQDFALQKLNIDNFVFTDWIEPDIRRGIFGPEEVKKKIKEYQEQSFNPGQNWN